MAAREELKPRLTREETGLPAGKASRSATDRWEWVRQNSRELLYLGVLVGVAMMALVAMIWSAGTVRAIRSEVLASSLLPDSRLGPQVEPTSETNLLMPVPTAISQGASVSEQHPLDSGKFPGTVEGPAIVEWWDGSSQEGIFRLGEGEPFSYQQDGTWWCFSSSAALDARYPTHRAEYFNSHPKGNEGRPED
ncbi:MAG TPA: hypothetical protein VMW25_03135 [Clostridia bacterium]|nr:hypothetical protein [Clostridia bacterium]